MIVKFIGEPNDVWNMVFTKNKLYEVKTIQATSYLGTREVFKYVRDDNGKSIEFDWLIQEHFKIMDDKRYMNVNESIDNDFNVIEHPKHYTQGSIEVIDFLEDQALDFRLANVIKYVCRYRFKGKPLEDLKKARWYLDRVIGELGGE